jgi:hypothetical protein
MDLQVEQLWTNIEPTIKAYNQSEIKQYLSIGDCYRLMGFQHMFCDKPNSLMAHHSYMIGLIFDWITVFGV